MSRHKDMLSGVSVIRARRFETGDAAAIFSPSSPRMYEYPERAARAVKALSSLLEGEVIVPDASRAKSGYRALSPDAAANELHRLARLPTVKLILSAVGGYNTNGILAALDWDLLRAHPKIYCGYSDATALLVALHVQTNLITLHGPALLPQFGDLAGALQVTSDSFLSTIRGRSPITLRPSGTWQTPDPDWSAVGAAQRATRHDATWTVLTRGEAAGPLIGGNVSTLNLLVGTPWAPRGEGRIVFMEATGADAYLPRYHRLLVHLRDSGFFQGARGLIIGRSPESSPVDGTTLEDVLRDVLPIDELPTIIDVDCGHTQPILTLPLGAHAALVAAPEDPRIVLLDAAVQA